MTNSNITNLRIKYTQSELEDLFLELQMLLFGINIDFIGYANGNVSAEDTLARMKYQFDGVLNKI